MEFDQLDKRLKNALKMLKTRDPFLLENKLSEWTLAHRLAVYLEEEIQGWNVDCEYNKQGQSSVSKANSVGKITRPDIVIHQRGEVKRTSNLLIIEIKIKNDLSDSGKCIEYTEVAYGKRLFQYQFGLLLSFSPNCYSCWYSKGKVLHREVLG